MGSSNSEAECAIELEVMRKEDSSWHPCQVSLSSSGVALIVDFGSQESKGMILNKEEAPMRLRIRSFPLQGDDCSQIEQGEHVLATHKSQFKSLFFEAEVEKVLRVRHSKKAHCRCTFMIRWLHQDPKGGTFTVPSSSIMKLATKRINYHPTVAAFLNSVNNTCLSVASFPITLDNMDVETDLNTLLDKQIEEISNSANAFKKDISEDFLLGGKIDNKRQTMCKLAAASKVSISHVQVSHDQNHFRRTTRSSRKLQVEMEVKVPPSHVLSNREELSEIRSHLSPLAARAALASLMSTTHKHDATESLDGIEPVISCIGNNMPMNDKLSSEILVASIPVVSDPAEMGNSHALTGSSASGKPQLIEASSGVQTKEYDNGTKTSEVTNSGSNLTRSITERKLNQPTKGTRVTHSSVKKDAGIPNDNVQMKTCAEDLKPRPSINVRRLTRSVATKEKESLPVEFKQGLEENKSFHITESDSPKGNETVPESNVVKNKSSVLQKEPASSLLDADTNFPLKERTKKQKLSSAVETPQQAKVVTKEKESLPVEIKQGFEENKSFHITESDSSEGNEAVPESNVVKNKSSVLQKEPGSSLLDAHTNFPLKERTEKQKLSSAVETPQQAEGNGANSKSQKRKSTSSKKKELRFSPRLRFLPRTRAKK